MKPFIFYFIAKQNCKQKCATCTGLLISISLAVAGGTVELLAQFQAFTVDNIYGSTSNARHFIFLLSQKKKRDGIDPCKLNSSKN